MMINNFYIILYSYIYFISNMYTNKFNLEQNLSQTQFWEEHRDFFSFDKWPRALSYFKYVIVSVKPCLRYFGPPSKRKIPSAVSSSFSKAKNNFFSISNFWIKMLPPKSSNWKAAGRPSIPLNLYFLAQASTLNSL